MAPVWRHRVSLRLRKGPSARSTSPACNNVCTRGLDFSLSLFLSRLFSLSLAPFVTPQHRALLIANPPLVHAATVFLPSLSFSLYLFRGWRISDNFVVTPFVEFEERKSKEGNFVTGSWGHSARHAARFEISRISATSHPSVDVFEVSLLARHSSY